MSFEKQTQEFEIRAEVQKQITRDIAHALSPVWAKSVQELIPGYLPDKATHEYTKEELSLSFCLQTSRKNGTGWTCRGNF